MKVVETSLPGVKVIEPAVFGDERGYLFEAYNADRFKKHGLDIAVVQTNISRSSRGVLRGLHFQWPRPQGKLVSVLEGEVYDVAVDVRIGSPTFGRWTGVMLTADNKRQLWIPEGFAHGFCVVSEHATFFYQCTDTYHPEFDGSIRWDDPSIGIDWPVSAPLLSGKDAGAPNLADAPPGRLPEYQD